MIRVRYTLVDGNRIVMDTTPGTADLVEKLLAVSDHVPMKLEIKSMERVASDTPPANNVPSAQQVGALANMLKLAEQPELSGPLLEAWRAITREMARGEALSQAGKYAHSISEEGVTEPVCGNALIEEVLEVHELTHALFATAGRVVRNLNDHTVEPLDPVSLREELIQVAAVAVAWHLRLGRSLATESAAAPD